MKIGLITFSIRIYFLIIFYLMFFIEPTICQDINSLDKINLSVQNELYGYLNMIPNGNELDYGFKNREDFKKIKVLKPIKIIFPTQNYYKSELFDSAYINLNPTDYWQIPISVNNVLCCFIYGKMIDNQFKIFSIGGNFLAHKMNLIKSKIENANYSILMFSDLKKQFILFNNENFSYRNTNCISLNEDLTPFQITELSLFDVLKQCKNKLTNDKK